MADPATALMAANVGISAGGAINSGIKGNRAANQADRAAQQQQQRFDQIFGMGTDILGRFGGLANDFANPQLGADIERRAREGADGLADIYGRGAEHFNGGSDLLGQAGDILGQSSMDTILGMVDSLGGFNRADIASQLDLSGGTASDRTFGVDPVERTLFQGNAFNFDGVNQLQSQAIETGQQAAGRAREQARAQTATNIQQNADALNAQLASRGISANSGVAGGALSELAQASLAQQTQLENSLANQAGQTALQFGQFDVQSGLQNAQMQAQDNQFFNQLGLQANNQFFNQGMANANLGLQAQQMQGQFDLANASNYLQGQGILAGALGQEAQLDSFLNQTIGNLAGQASSQELARAQGLAGLQGQIDERVLQGVGLGAAGITSPLDLLNDQYRNNNLAPMMGILGMINPGGLISGALGGMQGLTQMYGNNAGAAGAGKGAAMGGVSGGLTDMADSGDFNKPSSDASGGTAATPAVTGGGGGSAGAPYLRAQGDFGGGQELNPNAQTLSYDDLANGTGSALGGGLMTGSQGLNQNPQTFGGAGFSTDSILTRAADTAGIDPYAPTAGQKNATGNGQPGKQADGSGNVGRAQPTLQFRGV